jgi:hypothetical protein
MRAVARRRRKNARPCAPWRAKIHAKPHFSLNINEIHEKCL